MCGDTAEPPGVCCGGNSSGVPHGHVLLGWLSFSPPASSMVHESHCAICVIRVSYNICLPPCLPQVAVHGGCVFCWRVSRC